MSDDKPHYPEILRDLLDTPKLLPDENLEDFLQLYRSLEAYVKPKASWDYLAVYQATMLTFDILRCHGMKIGVLRSHRRPALEALLRKIHVSAATPGAEALVKLEAYQLASQWFADPASRPAIMKGIEGAGYPPNAVEVEAFQLALPILAPIERLIVSAQKRLDQYLKELEKSSKGRAEALRLATVKAIDANASASVKKAS
jgi:hypothetical protein